MKQGFNRKRFTRIFLAVLMLLCAVLLIWCSNYLVSFAIGRDKGTVNVAPETTLSDEAIRGIVDNWKKQAERAEEWASAATRETVLIESGDGLKLFGEAMITDETSHLWVIAVHGYRGNHRHMVTLASCYGVEGYNALLPDLRGCGESEGDYLGMGWLDRKDMLGWIGWITEKDPEARIVLHGISMGGAAVMMTAGEDLPSQVKAVVEDCGYTTVWDIFEDELAYLFRLPSFPLMDIASGFSKLRAGYGFRETSSLQQLERAEVPILFVHGSEDNFVHTEMVYRVFERCPTEKQLLVVEGAGHGNSFNYAPELYFETVFGFLKPYMVE